MAGKIQTERVGGQCSTDLFVPKMRLNFNFPAQLVLNLRFLKLGFEEDFQRHDVFALLFPCEVNVPELPLAQRSSDVEIIEGPPVTDPT